MNHNSYTKRQIRGFNRQRRHASGRFQEGLDVYLDVKLFGVVGFQWKDSLSEKDVIQYSNVWKSELLRYYMFIESFVAEELSESTGLIENIIEEVETRNPEHGQKIVASGGVCEDIYCNDEEIAISKFSKDHQRPSFHGKSRIEFDFRIVKENVKIMPTRLSQVSIVNGYIHGDVKKGDTVVNRLVYSNRDKAFGYFGKFNEITSQIVKSYNDTKTVREGVKNNPLVRYLIETTIPDTKTFLDDNFEDNNVCRRTYNNIIAFEEPTTIVERLNESDGISKVKRATRLVKGITSKLSTKTLLRMLSLALHWHPGDETFNKPKVQAQFVNVIRGEEPTTAPIGS